MLNYLLGKRKNTASEAKERLQIIVSHERRNANQGLDLSALQRDLLKVIARYVEIDPKLIKVELERADNCSVLELNVTLPDSADKS